MRVGAGARFTSWGADSGGEADGSVLRAHPTALCCLVIQMKAGATRQTLPDPPEPAEFVAADSLNSVPEGILDSGKT